MAYLSSLQYDSPALLYLTAPCLVHRLQLDYKYMFGIQCSNTKYPIQALRAMALQGKVTRLAIIGRNDVVSRNCYPDAPCVSHAGL
jgi:hypothetical protein